MKWITVTDGNGNDFPALSPNPDGDDGHVKAWVFFDKESGFGNNVGSVDLHKNLKSYPEGKFGA